MFNSHLLEHIENFDDNTIDEPVLLQDNTETINNEKKLSMHQTSNNKQHDKNIITTATETFNIFSNETKSKKIRCNRYNFTDVFIDIRTSKNVWMFSTGFLMSSLFIILLLINEWQKNHQNIISFLCFTFQCDIKSVLLGSFVTIVYQRCQNRLFVSSPTNKTIRREMTERRFRDSRQTLCQLLGIMGAPILQTNYDYSSISLSVTDSQIQDLFTTLEELIHAHLDLLAILEQAIDYVKIGTSLRFGKKSGTIQLNIDRIERTIVARAEKIQSTTSSKKTKSSSKYNSVTFPIIRQRIYDILDNQLSLLYECSQCYGMNTDLPYDVIGEAEVAEKEQMNDVITLSLLSSMKREVVDILSHVVSKWSCCTLPLIQDSRGIFQKTVASAREAHDYLRSSMSWYDNKQTEVPFHDENIQKLKIHLSDIQRDVDTIQVALLGCQESCMPTATSLDNNLVQGFVPWWDRIQNSLMIIQNHVSIVNKDLFPDNVAADDDSSITDAEIAKNLIDLIDKKLEYCTNEVEVNDSDLKNDGMYDQSGRTFVFSGNGMSIPKEKTSRKENTNSSVSQLPRKYDVNVELSLIEELKKRVEAMPSTEEFEVQHDAITSNIPVAGAKVLEENHNSVNSHHIPQPGGINILSCVLLEELKESIEVFGNRHDDECLVWD